MGLRAVAFALLALLLPFPAAWAGGGLDAGVLVVRVEDRFGDSCSHPVAGFCAFHVEDEGGPGDVTVDAYQRLDYVGVATDFSLFRERLGEAWLLPDLTLTQRGSDLHLRHDVLRAASETWMREAPRGEGWRVDMTEDNVTATYPHPAWSDPTGPWAPQEWKLIEYHDSEGIQYERLGPFTTGGGVTTDHYVDDLKNACVPDWCRESFDPHVDDVKDATPRARVGWGVQEVEVATDPSNLTPPSAPVPAPARNASVAGPRAGSPTAVEEERVASKGPEDEAAPIDPPARRRHAPEPYEPGPRRAPLTVQAARPEAPRDPEVALYVGAATAGLLLLGLGVGLYSRFSTRGEALRSRTRDRLMALVGERPGICLSDAAKEMGLTRNAVHHHARVLKRVGLLRIEREGSLRTLHPAGAPPAQDPPWLRRNETCLAILRALRASPEGLPREEIHRLLAEVPERTRNHHLRRLLSVGAVVQGEADGRRVLRAAPRGAPPSGGA